MSDREKKAGLCPLNVSGVEKLSVPWCSRDANEPRRTCLTATCKRVRAGSSPPRKQRSHCQKPQRYCRASIRSTHAAKESACFAPASTKPKLCMVSTSAWPNAKRIHHYPRKVYCARFVSGIGKLAMPAHGTPAPETSRLPRSGSRAKRGRQCETRFAAPRSSTSFLARFVGILARTYGERVISTGQFSTMIACRLHGAHVATVTHVSSICYISSPSACIEHGRIPARQS